MLLRARLRDPPLRITAPGPAVRRVLALTLPVAAVLDLWQDPL